jgi:hypothetical protein
MSFVFISGEPLPFRLPDLESLLPLIPDHCDPCQPVVRFAFQITRSLPPPPPGSSHVIPFWRGLQPLKLLPFPAISDPCHPCSSVVRSCLSRFRRFRRSPPLPRVHPKSSQFGVDFVPTTPNWRRLQNRLHLTIRWYFVPADPV